MTEIPGRARAKMSSKNRLDAPRFFRRVRRADGEFAADSSQPPAASRGPGAVAPRRK